MSADRSFHLERFRDYLALEAGTSPHTVSNYLRDVRRLAPPAARIEVLGPAEAPIAVVRGRHRWRLLVKAPRELDLQAYLRAWLATLPKPMTDLRLTVDIDPYSFL